jgi:hypothetical protein
MKILYAANKGFDSYLQLYRFLQYVPNTIEVRVAGYNGYLNGIAADYTLDSLFDYYGKNRSGPVVNKMLQRYTDEVATYNPDLIISDFEFFSSYAALEIDIPYWIVSPFLFYFAASTALKNALAIGQHYRHVLFRQKNFHRYQFQIENAERRLINSYLGDVAIGPDVSNGFEWVRPYHVDTSQISRDYGPEQPKPNPGFLGVFSRLDKPLVQQIQQLGGSIYSPHSYETFQGLVHRDIHDEHYEEDLRSCYLAIHEGETSFVSDAYYSNKFSLVFPNLESAEAVVNSHAVEYFGIGEKLRTRTSYEQINTLASRYSPFTIRRNQEIKHLHEYIEELI